VKNTLTTSGYICAQSLNIAPPRKGSCRSVGY